MSEHPDKVIGLSAEELAKEFSKTVYSYQKEFFYELAECYRKEAEADDLRGYSLLSALLWNSTRLVEAIANTMYDIWEICKSHTTIKKEKTDIASKGNTCMRCKRLIPIGELACTLCFLVDTQEKKEKTEFVLSDCEGYGDRLSCFNNN